MKVVLFLALVFMVFGRPQFASSYYEEEDSSYDYDSNDRHTDSPNNFLHNRTHSETCCDFHEDYSPDYNYYGYGNAPFYYYD
uniref:Secreted protein n=1 Tax=Angiostrongylus cantonensis TaxID=6313 RepID=A0A0K0D1T5_ANGCA